MKKTPNNPQKTVKPRKEIFMKKFIAVILCLVTTLAFASCAGKEPELKSSVDALYTKIGTANAEGELFKFDAERLYDDIRIKTEYYTEGFFAVPVESAGVEAVAFFKAVDAENAKTLKTCLENYIKSVQTEQKDYNADNYAVSLAAKVTVKGLYVYMIMSPGAEALSGAISGSFNE